MKPIFLGATLGIFLCGTLALIFRDDFFQGPPQSNPIEQSVQSLETQYATTSVDAEPHERQQANAGKWLAVDSSIASSLAQEDCAWKSTQLLSQFDSSDWKDLHHWQNARGFSLTQMDKAGQLAQTPSPMLSYTDPQLEQAAQNGDSEAMYQLATRYGLSDKASVNKQALTEEAKFARFQYLRQATNFGHVPAMLALSEYFLQKSKIKTLAFEQQQEARLSAYAWKMVAEWRQGLAPSSSGLAPLEFNEALTLQRRYINEISVQREQMGLSALDNTAQPGVVKFIEATTIPCAN